MRKLALALAAIGVLGLSVPAMDANAAPAAGRVQLAQADVKVKVKTGHRRAVKKVIVRRDRGLHRGWHRGHHRGWSHARRGATKVVIKRPHHRTVVKKTIIRR